MPLYEYACPSCGVFEASRPMTQASVPSRCPRCRRESHRLMSAAHIGGAKRARSGPRARRSPEVVARPERPPKVARPVATHGRPWMIGH